MVNCFPTLSTVKLNFARKSDLLIRLLESDFWIEVIVNKNHFSHVATASALGTPVGCLLASITMRRGRKVSLFVTSLISMAGWVTIYLSNNYEQIVAGRVISGLATGMASVPTTVYVAEIASAKWRSTMVTWTSISIALGVLIVYVFGYIFKVSIRATRSRYVLLTVIKISY